MAELTPEQISERTEKIANDPQLLESLESILDEIRSNEGLTDEIKSRYTEEFFGEDPETLIEDNNGLIDQHLLEFISTIVQYKLDKTNEYGTSIGELDRLKSVMTKGGIEALREELLKGKGSEEGSTEEDSKESSTDSPVLSAIKEQINKLIEVYDMIKDKIMGEDKDEEKEDKDEEKEDKDEEKEDKDEEKEDKDEEKEDKDEEKEDKDEEKEDKDEEKEDKDEEKEDKDEEKEDKDEEKEDKDEEKEDKDEEKEDKDEEKEDKDEEKEDKDEEKEDKDEEKEDKDEEKEDKDEEKEDKDEEKEDKDEEKEDKDEEKEDKDSPPAEADEHTVKKGDNLWDIVKDKYEFETNQEIVDMIKKIINSQTDIELKERLKETNGEGLWIGDEIILPNLPGQQKAIKGVDATETSDINAYTVKRGDSLWNIVKDKYRLEKNQAIVDKIKQIIDMQEDELKSRLKTTDGNSLLIGDEIKLPQ